MFAATLQRARCQLEPIQLHFIYEKASRKFVRVSGDGAGSGTTPNIKSIHKARIFYVQRYWNPSPSTILLSRPATPSRGDVLSNNEPDLAALIVWDTGSLYIRESEHLGHMLETSFPVTLWIFWQLYKVTLGHTSPWWSPSQGTYVYKKTVLHVFRRPALPSNQSYNLISITIMSGKVTMRENRGRMSVPFARCTLSTSQMNPEIHICINVFGAASREKSDGEHSKCSERVGLCLGFHDYLT